MLRDYQQHAINMLRSAFKDGHKHQALQMATASGKTHVAAVIIKNAIKKKKAGLVCSRQS